jgi:hypothetical protein
MSARTSLAARPKLSSVQDSNPVSTYPWPPASATGVGSMPGTDPAEAARLVLGELPDLPHLPELPARGPGGDLIGRTAALLVELPVETTARGWRFTGRPGRDMRRAQAMLARDLDAMEEAAESYQGPFKIQVCGPWTLAAVIELARSQNAALADRGAVADLTESLAEGVAAHVADVRRRVPGARVLLQLDEPALSAVIEGSVPTASGFGRLPATDAPDIETGLRAVLDAGQAPALVHCCGMSVPFETMRSAGAAAVSFDLSQLRRGEEEQLAGLVEAGLGVFVGAVPALPGPAGSPAGEIRTPGLAGAGAGRAAAGPVGAGPGAGRDSAGRDSAGRDSAGRDGAGRDGAGLVGGAGPGAGRDSAGRDSAGGPGAGRVNPDGISGGRTGPGRTRPDRARPGGTRPGGTRPGGTGPGQVLSREAAAGRVVELWRRMGWPAARGAGGSSGIAAQVVITPACGLAGAPPAYARAALACCREAGQLLPELIEEEAG